MKSVRRGSLSETTSSALGKLQKIVDLSDDPKEEAIKLWKHKENSGPRKAAFDEVRSCLKTMASGRARCMYCEDSEGTDIEHYRPKAIYPNAAFSWENYLSACSFCNSNEKRSAFPLDVTGSPLLLNPATDQPEAHLDFVPDTGNFVARSPKAVETIDLLGLNRRETLVQGRHDAWLTFCELLRNYGTARANADHARANRIRLLLENTNFACVLTYLVRIASAANAVTALPAELVEVVEKFPEIREWAR